MAYLTSAAVITPLGDSPEEFFQALLAGSQGFSEPLHFECRGHQLGVCHQIDGCEEAAALSNGAHAPSRHHEPRTHRLLRALRKKLPADLPSRLYLATTVGDIDLVTTPGERAVPDSPRSLLSFAKGLFGATEAMLVSSACASGQRALCLASEAVARGEVSSALVVGCDQVSEFVTSGFSALGALDIGLPRPYDASRAGMSLGESAAALVVASQPPKHNSVFCIHGYGETCDAAHVTAPDTTGTWLAAAIRKALPQGEIPSAVIGHGTGTIYNDQAELNALKIAFPDRKLPLFSLKGNIGHSLGTTGVLQTIAAMQILKTRKFPPQAGLEAPAPGADGAVATAMRTLPHDAKCILTLNAGFGGLNNALALTRQDNSGQYLTASAMSSPPIVSAKLLASAGDATAEEMLAVERDRLIGQGTLTAEATADFRRASLAVRHAILAVARLRQAAGEVWKPGEITLVGTGGDGVSLSNPAYWEDYRAHGSRRGRGTLFVDTLASIPLCEAAIALRLHGPAGYLEGMSREEILRTVKTPLALVLTTSATSAIADLYALEQ